MQRLSRWPPTRRLADSRLCRIHPRRILCSSFTASPARWPEPGSRRGIIDLLNDAGREVIAWDLPGHGSAEKHHDPAGYADMEAKLVERLAAESGDQPVDGVGFSMGARTVLAMAAMAPGTVQPSGGRRRGPQPVRTGPRAGRAHRPWRRRRGRFRRCARANVRPVRGRTQPGRTCTRGLHASQARTAGARAIRKDHTSRPRRAWH